MSAPARIAIAGLGWVALHRHLPAILRHPDLRLVGVIDRHEGLAEHVAREYDLPHFQQADTLDGLPWINEIDAITIGAPPTAHEKLALSALCQKKHVLTEKPFALTTEQAEAMAQAAQQNGITLSVVHNFQFARSLRKLHRDIQAGKLGRLRRIAATQLGNPKRRLPVWYESLPCGLFFDESPHFFYLLNNLCGNGLTLQTAYQVPDETGRNTPRLAHLLYKGGDGLPVTISCQFDSTLSEWHVTVTGEKETAIVDIFRDIYIRLPNDSSHKALDILRTSLYACAQHFWQHVPNGLALARGRMDYGNDEIIDRFARAIHTGQNDEKIGFPQALAVLKLQLNAIKALQDATIA
ncbi:MAG: Gfo/Idh/MocA family oxidoreductase [Proteobacteria bacterium]|jgi:predicted dehydrogenase|nr:Gfo/Idh/MocA family oxidoreductase [Alphaproteobacteria bacterium]NCC02873.1 Gfo/Idh/MocA family oxidoreductase [Pseudomonadota bacterium]